jgi:hypothetical protein
MISPLLEHVADSHYREDLKVAIEDLVKTLAVLADKHAVATGKSERKESKNGKNAPAENR